MLSTNILIGCKCKCVNQTNNGVEDSGGAAVEGAEPPHRNKQRLADPAVDLAAVIEGEPTAGQGGESHDNDHWKRHRARKLNMGSFSQVV